MTTAVIGAVAIVALAGYGMARVGRYVAAQWFIVRAWRWFSGQAHHGHPVTDAGWFREGQRALTRTGHATRWWHLPRWKRAAHRTGGTLAVVVLVLAFLIDWQGAALLAGGLIAGTVALGSFVTWHRARMREA